MNHKNRGKATHMVLTTTLTLLIVILAVYFNSFEKSPVAPIIAIISSDYQAESAMIMQIQRSENLQHGGTASYTKEIMPGVDLILISKTSVDGEWTFSVSLRGHGINASYTAEARQEWPDRIQYR